jgi:hypothetical protein
MDTTTTTTTTETTTTTTTCITKPNEMACDALGVDVVGCQVVD